MTPQQLNTMKLALEALELCNGAETVEGVVIYTDKEITAINEALAEHAMQEVQRLGQEIEQEPVATDWNAVHKKLELVWYRELSADEGLDEIQDLINTTPPQRKPLTDDLYNELLFAVENKYPDETRHQTALHYIKQAEMPSARPAQAAHDIKENT